jgi:hypothetical protein
MAKLTREDARRRMELAAELERLGHEPHLDSPLAGVWVRKRVDPAWFDQSIPDAELGHLVAWEHERIAWIERGSPVE